MVNLKEPTYSNMKEQTNEETYLVWDEGRGKIVKMAICPSSIYKFNALPIKGPVIFKIDIIILRSILKNT